MVYNIVHCFMIKAPLLLMFVSSFTIKAHCPLILVGCIVIKTRETNRCTSDVALRDVINVGRPFGSIRS